MSNASPALDPRVFYALMILLAWVPVPLAGNRPLFWSINALIVGVLLIIFLLRGRLEDVQRTVFVLARWPLVLFSLLCLWIIIQIIPITPEGLHHPLWRDAAAMLQRPLAGRISLNPGAGYEALVKLATAAGVFWLTAHYCLSQRRAHRVCDILAFIITIYAAIGLYFLNAETIFWYEKLAYRSDVTATFVNRNHFGTYAGIGLIVLLGCLIRRGRDLCFSHRDRSTSLIDKLNDISLIMVLQSGCFLIVMVALIKTHSRGAVSWTILGLLTMIILFSIRARARLGWIIIGMGSLALPAAITLHLSGARLVDRLAMLQSDLSHRNLLNEISTHAAADHLWYGAGYGAFADLFPLYRDDRLAGREVYTFAHNVYLETLLELGIIGTILIAMLLLFLLYPIVKAVWQRQFAFLIPIQGIALSVLIWGHAYFDFSVQIPAVTLTYAALLGVSWGRSFRVGEQRTNP